jgi:TPR repeat protein
MKNISHPTSQIIGFSLLLLALTPNTYSASFDCQKAQSANERLICDDTELSKLDDELELAYKDALRKSSNPKELLSNQRDAWKRREKECSSKACLANWFSERKTYFGANSPQSTTQVPADPPASLLANAENALRGKDYATAFRLFKSLADQGNAEAQANLGLMYGLGQGVNKNPIEAFNWYRSAAEQGIAWAQTNLGLAYISGQGTSKNDKEAAKWFRRAALQGSTKAQEVLGAMYNQGRGIPQSHKEAAEWINPSNLMYIAKLEKDYRKRVHFDSKKAERIVRDFNIDCKAPQGNGHYLPLINLLYARLTTADKESMWVETTILERDGDVRIIDTLRTPEKILNSNTVFQINKWGELQLMGSIRAEAVRNACFDSHGPIWLLD